MNSDDDDMLSLIAKGSKKHLAQKNEKKAVSMWSDDEEEEKKEEPPKKKLKLNKDSAAATAPSIPAKTNPFTKKVKEAAASSSSKNGFGSRFKDSDNESEMPLADSPMRIIEKQQTGVNIAKSVQKKKGGLAFLDSDEEEKVAVAVKQEAGKSKTSTTTTTTTTKKDKRDKRKRGSSITQKQRDEMEGKIGHCSTAAKDLYLQLKQAQNERKTADAKKAREHKLEVKEILTDEYVLSYIIGAHSLNPEINSAIRGLLKKSGLLNDPRNDASGEERKTFKENLEELCKDIYKEMISVIEYEASMNAGIALTHPEIGLRWRSAILDFKDRKMNGNDIKTRLQDLHDAWALGLPDKESGKSKYMWINDTDESNNPKENYKVSRQQVENYSRELNVNPVIFAKYDRKYHSNYIK